MDSIEGLLTQAFVKAAANFGDALVVVFPDDEKLRQKVMLFRAMYIDAPAVITTKLSKDLVTNFYATAMPLMVRIFASDASVLSDIKSAVFDDLRLHEKFEASSPEQQQVIFQHIHYLCELSMAFKAAASIASNIASTDQALGDYAEIGQTIKKVETCLCTTMPHDVMSLVTLCLPVVRSTLTADASSENIFQTLMPILMPVFMQLLQTFQTTQFHPDAAACLQECLPKIQAQGLALVQTKGLAGVLADVGSIMGCGDASVGLAQEGSQQLMAMFGHLLPQAGALDQVSSAAPGCQQDQQGQQQAMNHEQVMQLLQQSSPEAASKVQSIIAQFSTTQPTPEAIAKLMQELQSLM